jgi:hypothetical protein
MTDLTLEQRARELLEHLRGTPRWGVVEHAQALRDIMAALQQAQQPSAQAVGVIRENPDDIGLYADFDVMPPVGTKLYTAAPTLPNKITVVSHNLPNGPMWAAIAELDVERGHYVTLDPMHGHPAAPAPTLPDVSEADVCAAAAVYSVAVNSSGSRVGRISAHEVATRAALESDRARLRERLGAPKDGG